LAEGKVKCKVQDAYSMRSTPQLSAPHTMRLPMHARRSRSNSTELGYPVLPQENLSYRANFQGFTGTCSMDMAGIVVTMVSVMSERRMNRLKQSCPQRWLTGFSSQKVPALFQRNDAEPIYADMQIVEQRILSARLRYKVSRCSRPRKISFQWG